MTDMDNARWDVTVEDGRVVLRVTSREGDGQTVTYRGAYGAKCAAEVGAALLVAAGRTGFWGLTKVER